MYYLERIVFKLFSYAGARVVLACRDLVRAKVIQTQLIQTTRNPNITIEYIDLQSLPSVTAFACRIISRYRSIYGLVNIAGIFNAPPCQTVSQLDVTFQTNFVGPCLLTFVLTPSLRKNDGGARIIFVSSAAHTQVVDVNDSQFIETYDDTPENRLKAYQYSHFYIVLLAKHLQNLTENSAVSVHCVDPGTVETNLLRRFAKHPIWFAFRTPFRLLFVKTPTEGAQGILHALLSPQPPAPFYLGHLAESQLIHPYIADPRRFEQVWTEARDMVQSFMV